MWPFKKKAKSLSDEDRQILQIFACEVMPKMSLVALEAKAQRLQADVDRLTAELARIKRDPLSLDVTTIGASGPAVVSGIKGYAAGTLTKDQPIEMVKDAGRGAPCVLLNREASDMVQAMFKGKRAEDLRVVLVTCTNGIGVGIEERKADSERYAATKYTAAPATLDPRVTPEAAKKELDEATARLRNEADRLCWGGGARNVGDEMRSVVSKFYAKHGRYPAYLKLSRAKRAELVATLSSEIGSLVGCQELSFEGLPVILNTELIAPDIEAVTDPLAKFDGPGGFDSLDKQCQRRNGSAGDPNA